MPVRITLNGEERRLEAALTVAQLLELLGLAGRRVAVEVNHEIVPRSRHGEHTLRENDRVEVVRAIGGGSGMSRGGRSRHPAYRDTCTSLCFAEAHAKWGCERLATVASTGKHMVCGGNAVTDCTKQHEETPVATGEGRRSPTTGDMVSHRTGGGDSGWRFR